MDGIRPFPHAVGPEKAILSVLFQYPEQIDQAEALTADHFHIPAHRIIFESIRETIQEGKKVELISFIERLRTINLLDRCGGAHGICDIFTYAPSPSAFHQHLDILTENLARRTAILTATRLADAAYQDDMETVASCATSVATAFEAVVTSSTAPKTLKSILSEAADHFYARIKGTKDTMGIPTCSLLDRHIHGLHPGRLYIIGAYPEGGKSLLASQITVDAVLDGFPAIYLHLEMSSREIIDRMIIQASRVDATAFMEPRDYARENGNENLPIGLLNPIKSAFKRIAESPLIVQRPANKRISTIVAAIKRAHRETGIKFAVVDYIQIIKGSIDHRSREAEIAEVSHELQNIAQNLDISIIALTQLNDEGDTKHGRVIEEDADAVIRIVQDRNKESPTYKQHRHIMIDKDRHYGSGGTITKLILDRQRIRFVEGEDQTNAGQKRKSFQR